MRRPARTYEFPWSDVLAVEIGMETMGVVPLPATAFKLTSGRVVRAQATPERVDEQRAALKALSALVPSSTRFVKPT
jgi:hypothetical protein